MAGKLRVWKGTLSLPKHVAQRRLAQDEAAALAYLQAGLTRKRRARSDQVHGIGIAQRYAKHAFRAIYRDRRR